MKKSIITVLLAAVCLHSPSLNADGLDDFQTESNKMWNPSGDGSKDSSQDGQIATSMWAWGIGLAVVIGLVFGLVKSYNNTSTTN